MNFALLREWFPSDAFVAKMRIQNILNLSVTANREYYHYELRLMNEKIAYLITLA
jgi:hypothetical protein